MELLENTLGRFVEKKEIQTLILPQSRILGLADYNLFGKLREDDVTDLRAEHYDLLIDLTPSCPNVTGMRLTGLTATSVTVRWDNGTPGTTWQAAIETTPTANPSPFASNLTSPECTFDGLAHASNFQIFDGFCEPFKMIG